MLFESRAWCGLIFAPPALIGHLSYVGTNSFEERMTVKGKSRLCAQIQTYEPGSGEGGKLAGDTQKDRHAPQHEPLPETSLQWVAQPPSVSASFGAFPPSLGRIARIPESHLSPSPTCSFKHRHRTAHTTPAPSCFLACGFGTG